MTVPPARQLPSKDLARERSAEDDRDRALVAKVLGGDRDSFRGLVEAHQARVFHLARSLVKNRSDAADIAQETFVRAFVNLKTYRSEGSFVAWVCRIANNLAIDLLRRQKTQAVTEFDEGLSEADVAIAQPGSLSGLLRSDPQSEALRRELGAQLDRALQLLPEKHRVILLLREIDGLSYEQLAEVLAIPVGTVMSRLFHARAKMQAALNDYQGLAHSPTGPKTDE